MPQRDTWAMTRFTLLLHHVLHLAGMLLTLLVDVVCFLRFCLYPSAALAAENRFLRKQFALYQERQVTPLMPPASPCSGSGAGSTGVRHWRLCNRRCFSAGTGEEPTLDEAREAWQIARAVRR
jgi:hypothetical protein